jgi:hypothetical protein
MIRAYFEQIGHGAVVEVATFQSEEIYAACYPSLEGLAEKNGMILTEKVEENEHNNDDTWV